MKITWGSKLPIQETQCQENYTYNTPEEAAREAQSRVQHQIERKGYSYDIPSSPPDLPMLAQEYGKDRYWEPGFATQPKLDGIRCVATNETMLSRKNRSFSSAPWISLLLSYLPEHIKLDGELYIPNTPFHTIQSYIMRETPDRTVSGIIEYHIFDCIDTNQSFGYRYETCKQAFDILEKAYINIRTTANHPLQKFQYYSTKFPFKLVPTLFHEEQVSTKVGKQIIEEQLAHWKSLKFEGVMIRDLETPYEINKRSHSLLKYKTFLDHEFKIIDVIEGHDKQAVFVCTTDDGTEFRVSPKYNKSRRQQILLYKQNYVGKWLKVEHEGFFETGKPRCPVGVYIYDSRP